MSERPAPTRPRRQIYGCDGVPLLPECLWDLAPTFDRLGDETIASLLRDAGDEITDLREALQEALDYFDQRADITDAGVANECARLRETLRAALELAGEGDKP